MFYPHLWVGKSYSHSTALFSSNVDEPTVKSRVCRGLLSLGLQFAFTGLLVTSRTWIIGGRNQNLFTECDAHRLVCSGRRQPPVGQDGGFSVPLLILSAVGGVTKPVLSNVLLSSV